MPQVSITPPLPADRGVMTVTFSCSSVSPNDSKRQLAVGLQPLELVGHRHAVHALAGNHQEADGMDRHEAAGRQHGPLHALLPARLQPRAQVGRSGSDSPTDSADLAPIGSGRPTWATTTPISPARTCTQGCFSTM